MSSRAQGNRRCVMLQHACRARAVAGGGVAGRSDPPPRHAAPPARAPHAREPLLALMRCGVQTCSPAPSHRARVPFELRCAAQFFLCVGRAREPMVCSERTEALVVIEPRSRAISLLRVLEPLEARRAAHTQLRRVRDWKLAAERAAARWRPTGIGVQEVCGSWGGCAASRSSTLARVRDA
jgi:hypothetical protein